MKTVLVTGSSRGLGLAISSKLIEDGFYVIGIARRRSADVDRLAEKFPDAFEFKEFDLAEVQLIHEFVVALQKDHGRFFGLVNNAGVGLDGLLATMHEKDIQTLTSVNFLAPILLCKYLSRGMLANRAGRIVNISSIIGSTGFSGLAVYGATKAGLHGLTKSLSRELGKGGVTVNTVSPGYMETQMVGGLVGDQLESIRRRSPFQRFPNVDEVAAVVSFLLSEAGRGIHGTNVVVDLGSTA